MTHRIFLFFLLHWLLEQKPECISPKKKGWMFTSYIPFLVCKTYRTNQFFSFFQCNENQLQFCCTFFLLFLLYFLLIFTDTILKGEVKGSIIFSWTIYIIFLPLKIYNSYFTYDQRHILTGLFFFFLLQIKNWSRLLTLWNLWNFIYLFLKCEKKVVILESKF